MHRRALILQSLGALLALGARAQSVGMTADHEKLVAKLQAEAIAKFPFKLVQVHGSDALAQWQKLKSAGNGIPIVIGSEESLARMMDLLDPSMASERQSVSEILAAADRLKIPDDLFARRDAADLESKKYYQEMLAGPDEKLPRVTEERSSEGQISVYTEQWFGHDAVIESAPGPNTRILSAKEKREYFNRQMNNGPKVGDWPPVPPPSVGLSVAMDLMSGQPLEKVYIALIPAKDWTEVPAYLNMGDWNDCPPAEYHVATLRSWRDRYGAELIGLALDTMNLRASRRPTTQEESLALAREQYAYCTDIVDQGVQTLSALAASLYQDDWWFFWWD